MSGETVSAFGDAFFNLAVVWVVWSQTQSVLQTAIIQVVWHLSTTLVSPIAGVLADRGRQRELMIGAFVLSAAVVGLLALTVAGAGQLIPALAFVAIFALNSLFAFAGPARAAIFPEIVGRTNLVSASGLFSSAKQTATAVGNAAGGLVVATLGAFWALLIDAGTFLFAALCVLVAVPRVTVPAPVKAKGFRAWDLASDISEGWNAIAGHEVLRSLVVLSLVVNLTSFLGPLWPALVDQRLQGGAAAYGLLNAAGVVGGIGGGLAARPIERRLGTGATVALGWISAAVAIIGVAISTSLPATVLLESAWTASAAIAGVASFSLITALAAGDVRGRVYGISRSVSTIAIPISALVGAWLADSFGVVPMFMAGGGIMMLTALAALTHGPLRRARV